MELTDRRQGSSERGSALRKAATYTGQHNAKQRRYMSTTRVGLEQTIPVFEGAKTFRSSDHVATLVGFLQSFQI
jgi:hypothetical protein